jgi:hypothetical protein
MLAATKAAVCAILNTYHQTEGNSYIERFHRSLKGGSLEFGVS